MADFADVFWRSRKCVSVQETEAACAQLEVAQYVLVDLEESSVIDEGSNEESYKQNKDTITPLCVDGDDILSIPPTDNDNPPAVEVGLVEIDVQTAETNPRSPITVEINVPVLDKNATVPGGNAETSGRESKTEKEQYVKESMRHNRVISHKSRTSLTSRRIAKNVHSVVYRYRCKDCWRKFHKRNQLDIHTSTRHVKFFPGSYNCKYCSLTFSNVRAFYSHCYFSHGKLFSCDVCGDVSVTCKEYETHQKIHVVQTVHQCSACNMKFKSKSRLFTHNKIHERNYQYTHRMLYIGCPKQTPKPHILSCSFCSKIFKNKENLYRHLLIHSNSRCHICNICNDTFESLSVMHLHKKLKHPNENCGQCEECGKVFQTRFKLYRHRQTHKVCQSHLCSVCGNAFARRDTLVNHMKTHNNTKTYVLCQICGKNFRGRGRLMEHIQRKHKNALIFNCEHCEKKFPNKEWYTEHLYVHTGVKGFKCLLCQKQFITHHHYNEHVKTHDKPKQKGFSCDICGKISHCLSRYERHKLVHIEKGTYPCSVCDKKFKHPYHLKRHLIYIHSEDKQYKCAFCSKSFRQLHYLRSHETNHSNTSKYVCKECGKEFMDEAEFVEHRKSHFKCRHCSESFVQKTDLILHERSHKGIGGRIRKRKCQDKPKLGQPSSMVNDKRLNRKRKKAVSSSDKQKFICSFCGKELKTKSSLRYHMFIHKVPPNQCLYCDKVFVLKPALLAHERSHLLGSLDSTKRKSESGSCSSESRSLEQVNVIAEVDMLTKLDASFSLKLSSKATNTKASGNLEEMQSADAASFDEASLLKRLENPESDLRRSDRDLIGKRCDECGNFYSNEKQLMRHKLVHVRTRKFNCPICKKEFVENFHVTRHLGRVHKDAKPFTCKVCKDSFGKEWLLREHTKSAHPDKYTYACVVCGQEFKTKSELTGHRFKHEFTTFQCRYCDKKFSWKGPAIQHEKQHKMEIAGDREKETIQGTTNDADTIGIDANCEDESVEKLGDSNDISEIVVQTEHPQNRVSFDLVSDDLYNSANDSNKQDNDKPSTPDRKNQNLVTNTEGIGSESLDRNYEMENGMFSCNVCGKKFPYKRNIQRHIKKVHFCQRWFSCPLCDRSFKDSFKVSDHIYKSHKGAKPYRCESCGEKFAKNCSLRAHIKYNHPENHTFVCSVCGEEFRKKKDLRNHRFSHSESIYKCRFCNLTLSWKQAMVRHEAAHIAEKKGTFNNGPTKKTDGKKTSRTKSVKHKCEVCNKIFTLKKDLDLHSKSHSTPKSHDCPLCGKHFDTSMEVPQHIWKGHLQSKPFKCPHCTETFNDAKSLVVHIKMSHGDNPNVNVNSLINFDKLVGKTETGREKTGITVKVIRIQRNEKKHETHSVVTNESIENATQKKVQSGRCQINCDDSRSISPLPDHDNENSNQENISDYKSTLDLNKNNTEISLSEIPKEESNVVSMKEQHNSDNSRMRKVKNAKECGNKIQKTESLAQNRINMSPKSTCHKGDVALPGHHRSYIADSCQYYTRSRSTRTAQNNGVKSSEKESGSSMKCYKNGLEGEDANSGDRESICTKQPKSGSSRTPIGTRENTSSDYHVPSTDNGTPSKTVNKEQGNFECSLCKNNFNTSGKLMAHLRDDHGWSIPPCIS